MYGKTMIQTVSFTVTVVCCFCFVNMARSKVVIGPGTVVSPDAELKGDVTIGRGTVIRPKVRIIAERGSIIIGEGIVIEGEVLILNRAAVAPGSHDCYECELKGDISIGSGTVIQTKAQIIAEGGPIIIGKSNVIGAEDLILNAVGEKSAVMMIGAGNVFKGSAHIESLRIGDGNVFESNCYVGRHAEVTSGCVVKSNCKVTCNGVIPRGTVTCGNDCH